jgi:hypothetical protein
MVFRLAISRETVMVFSEEVELMQSTSQSGIWYHPTCLRPAQARHLEDVLPQHSPGVAPLTVAFVLNFYPGYQNNPTGCPRTPS